MFVTKVVNWKGRTFPYRIIDPAQLKEVTIGQLQDALQVQAQDQRVLMWVALAALASDPKDFRSVLEQLGLTLGDLNGHPVKLAELIP